MIWTALVPIKPDGTRKTRLSSRMASDERNVLGQSLLDHLVDQLENVARIGTIFQLSAHAPTGLSVSWMVDRGRGLNAEIEAGRASLAGRPFVVIHPDLPLVRSDDINILLDDAERVGCAIAGDRHGTGTNALALANGEGFRFHFGPCSLSRHVAEAGFQGVLVQRPGLALDCDTPDDLEVAIAGGFVPPMVQ